LINVCVICFQLKKWNVSLSAPVDAQVPIRAVRSRTSGGRVGRSLTALDKWRTRRDAASTTTAPPRPSAAVLGDPRLPEDVDMRTGMDRSDMIARMHSHYRPIPASLKIKKKVRLSA
jgi:hypothetical protein